MQELNGASLIMLTDDSLQRTGISNAAHRQELLHNVRALTKRHAVRRMSALVATDVEAQRAAEVSFALVGLTLPLK